MPRDAGVGHVVVSAFCQWGTHQRYATTDNLTSYCATDQLILMATAITHPSVWSEERWWSQWPGRGQTDLEYRTEWLVVVVV